MKRHKHSILAVLAALLWGSLSATPYRPVWEIGRKDGSAAEFALYDGAYSDLLGRFPGAAAAYDVGRSTPGEIPYILPGPQDGWAGNGNGSLLIRFGADAQASRAEMRLTLYLGRIAGLVTPDDRNLRRRVPHLGAGACRGRHQLPGYQTHLGHAALRSRPYCGRDIRRRGKPPHDPQCRRAAGSSGTPSSSKPTAA